MGVRIAFGWGTGIVWVLVRRLYKVPGVLYASKSRGTEYILFDSGKRFSSTYTRKMPVFARLTCGMAQWDSVRCLRTIVLNCMTRWRGEGGVIIDDL